MNLNEVNAKMQAEKAYYADQQKNAVCGAEMPSQNLGVCGQEYRPSPAVEAEKNYYHLQEQAMKAGQAAEFLKAHPEFSEFIKLIRSGAIGI